MKYCVGFLCLATLAQLQGMGPKQFRPSFPQSLMRIALDALVSQPPHVLVGNAYKRNSTRLLNIINLLYREDGDRVAYFKRLLALRLTDEMDEMAQVIADELKKIPQYRIHPYMQRYPSEVQGLIWKYLNKQ